LSEKDSIKDFDTVLIQRVKAAGLVIIGISHMTQMGMSVFGNNPSTTHGTCKNPMNPAYYPGASSSGTAAAICSGLVPFGIGTDGGGSIRMPSSQCGIVGLKPTFGRCPSHGRVKGACQGTVSHVGPMAATSNDLAILYQIMAGPHEDDPYSALQPKVSIPAAFTPSQALSGLKIGVDWLWAKQANSDVYEKFRRSIDHLKEMGAEICQVNVTLIPETNTAHIIAITFIIYLSS
jgi:Asp-tRNA(Asn)/Glu-tRNA(Gln) amidotransferase A subunit family amidase